MSRAFGIRHKALLPVGGTPMLARVMQALQSSPLVDGITIISDDESIAEAALGAPLPPRVRTMPAAHSAAASVLRALEATPPAPERPVLVTTADHALLTPEMLDPLHEAHARYPEADLLVGLVRREVLLAQYPDARRTWLRFGPDAVTSCNLFLFRTPCARKAAELWLKLEAVRKRPWRIVSAFGLVPLLRWALGMTTLRDAFAAASARLGLVALPVEIPIAEAAIDMDKPEDLALAERILRQRRQ